MRLLMLAMALVMVYGLARAWIAVRTRGRLNGQAVDWKTTWDPKD